MQKYRYNNSCGDEWLSTPNGVAYLPDGAEFYLATDVDARIAALESALREAMGWDWLTDAPPPKEIVEKCEAALNGSLMDR